MNYKVVLVIFIVIVDKGISLLVYSFSHFIYIFLEILKIVTDHFYFDTKEPPKLATCQTNENSFSYQQDIQLGSLP